jgi:hypothetical protein
MRHLIAIATLFLCAFVISAAEVAGSWFMEVETPNGKFESTIDLKQDGEKLAGTIHNQFGDSEITGSIKENDIVLNQKFNFNGQDLLIVYTGKLDATGKLSGRFKFGEQGEGGWIATKK